MIKAIIIDDEMHCRKTLEILLNEYCPDVQVLKQCADAKTGLEAIKKFNPDLVFLDIEMPHMNGFELLQQVKSKQFHLIFTTAYNQYAIKAIKYAAFDYLLKPIDPEQLREAVARVAAAIASDSRHHLREFRRRLTHEK